MGAWASEYFLTGPTGVGKTWLARTLAQKARCNGYTAWFTRSADLFCDLATARVEGGFGPQTAAQVPQVDVLVVDDWAMAPLADHERRESLEICDDRYQPRATLLTSQLPIPAWHPHIGDPTLADNILDRLVHNAHRIELHGESTRKRRTQKSGLEEK